MTFPAHIDQGYIISFGREPGWNHFFFSQYEIDATSDFPYRHRFCGLNDVPGAGCPNCGQPLLCPLKIDTTDSRLGLTNFGSPTIPFLYCWSCALLDHSASRAYVPLAAKNRRRDVTCLTGCTEDAVYQWGQLAPFFYQIGADGSTALKQYGLGMKDGPIYDNYPPYFPEATPRLLAIAPDTQDALKKINRQDPEVEDFAYDFPDLRIPQHQIGGEPYLIQEDVDYRMLCPNCKCMMPFLVSM